MIDRMTAAQAAGSAAADLGYALTDNPHEDASLTHLAWSMGYRAAWRRRVGPSLPWLAQRLDPAPRTPASIPPEPPAPSPGPQNPSDQEGGRTEYA